MADIERITIIGFGTMGEAIARGLLSRFPKLQIGVIEKKAGRRERANAIAAVTDLTESGAAIGTFAPIVVLAVKPQDLATFADESGSLFRDKDVISILAGTTIDRLQKLLPGARIVRFMPNIAASVGRAPVAIAAGKGATENSLAVAKEVASSIGTPFDVPESLMGAFTGVSGSGIAYLLSFLDAMALGGTRAGIPYDQSLSIAIEMAAGAVELLKTSSEHPRALMSKVASPAGTTIEGIHALESSQFGQAVMDAVTRAAARAAEMES